MIGVQGRPIYEHCRASTSEDGHGRCQLQVGSRYVVTVLLLLELALDKTSGEQEAGAGIPNTGGYENEESYDIETPRVPPCSREMKALEGGGAHLDWDSRVQ